ncbi:MAG: hypothetical protein ACRD2G_17215, partial [Terriglobia bacterium]
MTWPVGGAASRWAVPTSRIGARGGRYRVGRRLIRQGHFGLRNDGSGLVLHRAHNGAGIYLSSR